MSNEIVEYEFGLSGNRGDFFFDLGLGGGIGNIIISFIVEFIGIF